MHKVALILRLNQLKHSFRPGGTYIALDAADSVVPADEDRSFTTSAGELQGDVWLCFYPATTT